MARPTAGPGRSTSPPRPSEGQGKPLCGRRVGPLLFWDLVALFCWQRVTGTQGLFVWDGGRFLCPHAGPFSHALVSVSRPRLFFFKERDGPRGPAWIASRYTIQCRIQNAAPRIPRNTLRNPGYVRPPPLSCVFW